MSWDLLSPLLDDAHNVKVMMRTLSMTSMDRLNHMLFCIDDVKEMRRRLDHLNNIRNQSLRLPPTHGRGRGRGVVDCNALIPRVRERYCDIHTQGENTLTYIH